MKYLSQLIKNIKISFVTTLENEEGISNMGKNFSCGVLNVIKKAGMFVVILLVIVVNSSSVILYNLSEWVLETWKNLSIDEIIFHIKAPVEGTNEELIVDAIETCLPSGILVFMLTFVLFVGIRKSKKRWKFLSVCATLVCSVYLLYDAGENMWTKLNIGEYMEKQKMQSQFIQDYYVDERNIKLEFPEQKKNLVYIFLESMETTYMDEKSGGAFEHNCIPYLSELAEENINFSNTEKLGGAYQTIGTTWTMGAMFAQTTGLPLKLPIDGNSMGFQNEFLPDVITLGDILEDEGYRQILMIGSDAAFAGRNNYFTEHGNYEIWDYYTALEEQKIPLGYEVWWGYEDAKLFEFAKEKLTELSLQKDPFNFTLLTVDTHAEDGYVCPLCDSSIENQYERVIECSDRQTREFVDWIMQQSFYENTVVIVVGDHLTMDADFCIDVPENYNRGVYNAFLNTVTKPINTKNRIFTTMDIFPTTLASMGVQIEGERLGLGTNLFSDVQTIAEEVGIDYIQEELEKSSSFFENFTKDIDIKKDN